MSDKLIPTEVTKELNRQHAIANRVTRSSTLKPKQCIELFSKYGKYHSVIVSFINSNCFLMLANRGMISVTQVLSINHDGTISVVTNKGIYKVQPGRVFLASDIQTRFYDLFKLAVKELKLSPIP